MTREKPNILIVDDKPENLVALERILADLDVTFVRALSGNEALKQTLEIDFALVLMDVQMPGMDGFEAVTFMRQEKRSRHVPVIFLSAIYKEEDYQLRGIQAGAFDFIPKPIVPAILIAKVRVFLDLYENRRSMAAEIRRRKASEEALEASRKTLEELNEKLEKNLGELKASEERFKSLVYTIPDIVYRIDRDGRFTFLNDAVSRLGYDPTELSGRHFSEIIAPPEVDRVSREAVLPRYRGQSTGPEGSPKLFDERRTGVRKTSGLEIRLVSRDRKKSPGLLKSISDEGIVAEVNSAGLYRPSVSGPTRIFIGTVGVIRDITDRKRIETALKESEERLRTILERTEAGIMLIDAQTQHIVEANPAALDMIGATRDETIGRPCYAYFCPAQAGDCPVKDRGESIDRSERELVRADGTVVPILKTVATVFLEGREHYLESFVDISGLKQAEAGLRRAHDEMENRVEERTRELKEANRKLIQEMEERRRAERAVLETQSQLIQAEKAAALGTLTAGIAHELNNPLMGMLNFIHYCLKHTDEDDRRFVVLKDAEAETRRCADIVRNLLTFSRAAPGGERCVQKERVDLLLRRVFRLVAFRLEKDGVQVFQKISDETPEIPMDADKLQQVFLNLIGNALDALEGREKKEIRVRVSEENGRVSVALTDTGCGISQGDLQRIYDPFFTTKPPGRGTGLGLSLSRAIVEDHGGTLVCESREGKGSTFRVSLPVNGKEGETHDQTYPGD